MMKTTLDFAPSTIGFKHTSLFIVFDSQVVSFIKEIEEAW